MANKIPTLLEVPENRRTIIVKEKSSDKVVGQHRSMYHRKTSSFLIIIDEDGLTTKYSTRYYYIHKHLGTLI